VDGKDPRCSRMFFPFFSLYPDFLIFFSSPMFFTKNETYCLIRNPMRPLLWLVQVLAKRHQQPHTDPQLRNLSSHCFMPAPHNRYPRTTFLNRVRSSRSNLSQFPPSFSFYPFFFFFGFLCCSFITVLSLFMTFL